MTIRSRSSAATSSETRANTWSTGIGATVRTRPAVSRSSASATRDDDRNALPVRVPRNQPHLTDPERLAFDRERANTGRAHERSLDNPRKAQDPPVEGVECPLVRALLACACFSPPHRQSPPIEMYTRLPISGYGLTVREIHSKSVNVRPTVTPWRSISLDRSRSSTTTAIRCPSREPRSENPPHRAVSALRRGRRRRSSRRDALGRRDSQPERERAAAPGVHVAAVARFARPWSSGAATGTCSRSTGRPSTSSASTTSRARGHKAMRDGEQARARECLDEALQLWRGDALADVAYEQFAQGRDRAADRGEARRERSPHRRGPRARARRRLGRRARTAGRRASAA